jgi:DNA polymerase-3 subunit gamma/tau
MSKDASTVALMEVTDDVKARFSTQSASVDLRFLVRALDAVNQADVQYKGSNHQRLLVELTLMQLASFTEAEKKKPELTPIEAGAWSADAPSPKAPANPVTAATAAPLAPVPVPAPEPKPAPAAEQSTAEEPHPPAPAPAPVREKTKAPTAQAVPSLGIAAPSTLMDVAKPVQATEPSTVREQPVTAEAVEKAWEAFIVTVESEGQFNLHTTLKATTMGFNDATITLNVLNRLQTEQIREVQLRLNQYFADQLENDTLKVVVEMAELESTTASTEFMNDRERYVEMVKKNPKLDELRKRLDLDLLG